MHIGSYVRQSLFENSDGLVWRYGIVVSKDVPQHLRALYELPVKVVFTPHKSHPVGVLPYAEYVESSKLEVVGG
jgi:hypothetical protein